MTNRPKISLWWIWVVVFTVATAIEMNAEIKSWLAVDFGIGIVAVAYPIPALLIFSIAAVTCAVIAANDRW